MDRQVLLLGGGPNSWRNPQSIEKAVLKAQQTFTGSAKITTLYGSGMAEDEIVLYKRKTSLEENLRAMKDRAFYQSLFSLKKTELKPDGALTQYEIELFFESIYKNPPEELVIFTAGHGKRGGRGEATNSSLELWGGGELSTRELATLLKPLKSKSKVYLIMSQCFSGGFASVFNKERESLPKMEGYFASAYHRAALGCSPEVYENDLRDFSQVMLTAFAGIRQTGYGKRDTASGKREASLRSQGRGIRQEAREGQGLGIREEAREGQGLGIREEARGEAFATQTNGELLIMNGELSSQRSQRSQGRDLGASLRWAYGQCLLKLETVDLPVSLRSVQRRLSFRPNKAFMQKTFAEHSEGLSSEDKRLLKNFQKVLNLSDDMSLEGLSLKLLNRRREAGRLKKELDRSLKRLSKSVLKSAEQQADLDKFNELRKRNKFEKMTLIHLKRLQAWLLYELPD